LADGIDDVLTIAEKLDIAGRFQRLSSSDDSHDFHAIIGCIVFAAAGFLAFTGRGVLEDSRPPAGAGVADAGTIGEEFDDRALDFI
jgi:hypothetical protein